MEHGVKHKQNINTVNQKQFGFTNSAASSFQQDYRQLQDESITRSKPLGDAAKDFGAKQKPRFEGALRHKEEPSHVNFVTPATSSEEQEVLL